MTNSKVLIKVDWPLSPVLVVKARITEPHVKVGRHDESEEGDGTCSNQVKNASKVWDGLRNEQKDDNAQASEQTTFPVKVWNGKKSW